MHTFSEYISLLLSSEQIIQQGSVFLIVLIVFLETGVIFTFFLPGDYLLFLAGMYCTTLNIDITSLCSLIIGAAILGYFVAYFFGQKIGDNLYNRKDSRFFKRKYLIKTESFFKKFGTKSLIICRFLPIVRTFMPVVAGIIRFPFFQFMFYNIGGAVIWVLSMVLSGYFLVDFFPGLKNYVGYIVVFFIAITSVTVIRSWWLMRNNMDQVSDGGD